jgi:hypothetical protein
MGRTLLESLALFFAPFALFALYLVVRLRYPLAVEHWSKSRVATLTLVGLAAVLAGFVLLQVTAPRGQGRYVPAHVENGVLVPGKIE